MANRDTIIKFCEEYLKVNNFQDHCINGLQVEGAPEVNKIITGVTLSARLIRAGIEQKAQMIMVHHGIFSGMMNKDHQIKGVMKNRLKMLLKHDINLAGFHLPLDAHPFIGNNVSLCKLLGMTKLKPVDIGFSGELPKEIDRKDFMKLLDAKLNTESYIIKSGPKKVKRIAIISGRAGSYYAPVVEQGIETLLTGEIVEENVRETEECGLNLIAAGHYNTEKLGIQNLGKLVARKFGVRVEYVDVPNEI